MNSQNHEEQARYRIGQAAKLSGVAVATIRMWERRYTAVDPRRDEANRRFYTDADVKRLHQLQQLVNAGARIGDIAGLPDHELQQRTQAGASAPRLEAVQTRLSVVVVGSGLAWLEDAQSEAGLEIVAALPDLESLAAWSPARDVHAVILRRDRVDESVAHEILNALQRSGQRFCLLLYDFAAGATLDRLRLHGLMPLKATSDAGEIRHVLLARYYWEYAGRRHGQRHLTEPVPARKFGAAELARLAAQRSILTCECPRHLADLISALSAFESYSADCEEASVQDAAIHAMLRSAAAHARATLETAVERLLDDEGLDLEQA